MNNSQSQKKPIDKGRYFSSLNSKSSFWIRVKMILNVSISMAVLVFWSLLMALIALLTLFRARRLYNEYLAKWLAQFLLWQWRINVIVHDKKEQTGQVIYISNHSSTIDIFVLLSLGLIRCRYFLFGRVRRIIPLGIIATIMGTFFTFPQSQPEKRTRVFKKANDTLKNTGESVYLSPEGKRVTSGKIGHFNKGAFHLATNLKVPIVPFYIQIPKQINPGLGLNIKPGTIHIYFKEPIETIDWKLEGLIDNKEKVKKLFEDYQLQHPSH